MWRIVKAAMMKQSLLEAILAEEQLHWRLTANSGFLVGDGFTFADLLLAHVVSWAQRMVAGQLEVPTAVASHCEES